MYAALSNYGVFFAAIVVFIGVALRRRRSNRRIAAPRLFLAEALFARLGVVNNSEEHLRLAQPVSAATGGTFLQLVLFAFLGATTTFLADIIASAYIRSFAAYLQ